MLYVGLDRFLSDLGFGFRRIGCRLFHRIGYIKSMSVGPDLKAREHSILS
jgi:hypothetical protein